MNSKRAVLHLIDSLAPGGAEHVAVMLANNLNQDHYRTYLCTTRQEGPLKKRLKDHVVFYNLKRKGRFDLLSIIRLAKITRSDQIQILHAHTTSLFIGAIVCILNSKLLLIWHDHFGLHEHATRPVFLYRLFARRAQAIFTVTHQLTNWAIKELGMPKNRVIFLPNFVAFNSQAGDSLELPGERGKRVVCVANIRSQKDHFSLIRAFSQVVQIEPKAHLILVGAETDLQLAKQVWHEVQSLVLEQNVTWLGQRWDVPDLLLHCDIGVLSSISEGFPLALLEYGHAGLPVVATRVGECAEILDNGSVGILVPPANPDALAASLLLLLASKPLRTRLGKSLRRHIYQEYSVEKVIANVEGVYNYLLQEDRQIYAN